MKKNYDTKLGNLVNPTPTVTPKARAQEPAQEPATEKTERERKNNKVVCYSIDADTADKIRKIAEWEGRKLNAVVIEAFEQYIAKWVPTPKEPPKF